MKVSIITITYNRAHLIGETIKSIISQSYQNFEHIIIDDGSTDNTEEIIRNFNDDRIKYYKYKKSGWRSYLRNEGFRKAEGELITVLDSDDIWTNNKLEVITTIFKKNPEINFVIHNISVLQNNGSIKNPFHKYKSDFYRNILDDLLKNKILPYPIFTVKAKLFKKINFLDETKIDGQHDLYLRIASKYDIYYSAQNLTIMNKHDQNISSKKDIRHYIDYLSSLVKLSKENCFKQKEFKSLCLRLKLIIFKHYLKKLNLKQAIKYL